jgi:hypothetical protein
MADDPLRDDIRELTAAVRELVEVLREGRTRKPRRRKLADEAAAVDEVTRARAARMLAKLGMG